MMKASEVTACVVDHGLFLPTAITLSRQFKTTYYWTPNERAFPTLREGIVGDGFDKLHRVLDFWKIKPECDLFVFPDIGFSGLQSELKKQGYAVWGSNGGDSIEILRGKFLDTLMNESLPYPPNHTVRGITDLREHLRDKTDKWIKISKWRGDMETFHWQDWDSSESILDGLAVRFGPLKESLLFYVIDPIKTEIEDGLDTYCIDGKLPGVCLHAVEKKDKALLGTVAKFKDIPEEVRMISERFAPLLAAYEYRQFFSTEVRIADGKSYFIDPTLRCASPVSQLQTELYSNLGEIIWQGAQGKCIDPEPTAEFGVQLALEVKREPGEWAVVKVPKELQRWVKCGFAAQVKDRICVPPNDWMQNEFGWLVATGSTIEEAVSNIKAMAEKLPSEVVCDPASLAFLIDEVKSAEAKGMEFTDQPVPEPATAIK